MKQFATAKIIALGFGSCDFALSVEQEYGPKNESKDLNSDILQNSNV